MAIQDISFPSYNGEDNIHGWIYTPIVKPRGIVQIVHGFGENSRRYMHMIYKMIDAGFIVCADDHVAHGKTAEAGNSWGHPGDKGYITTIEDENTLRKMVEEQYPGLPYFMFGHSWGSMIARGYAGKYSAGMSGLILCGVASQMSSVDNMDRGAIKADIAAGNGREPGLAYMGALFAGLTDRYDNPNGPNDWIARSAEVVADHAADPYNLKQPATIQLMADFVDMYDHIMSTEWAESVPVELPVYIIAGDGDPVANYGEGAYHVHNMLWNTGHRKVRTHVYPGYRHEIHNEPEIRDQVVDEIIEFIDSAL